MNNTPVDIIVIGYNLPVLEKKCLDSITKNTQHPHTVTFFDNYNSGLTLTQAWNKLISKSKSELICLLNNDTEVFPFWLTRLVKTLVEVPDCGFVGPSTNNCHSPQKGIPTYEEAEQHKNICVKMHDPISGFCVLFKRDTWVQLGGFNEKFTLYGQESDFIDRAKTKLSLHCYWQQDAFVFHHGEASIKAHGKDIENERAKGRKLYWSTRRR